MSANHDQQTDSARASLTREADEGRTQGSTYGVRPSLDSGYDGAPLRAPHQGERGAASDPALSAPSYRIAGERGGLGPETSLPIPEPKRVLRPLFGLNTIPLPKRQTDPRVNRALVHTFRARHAEMQMTDTERRGYRALRCRVSCEAQP